jgi:hypothetical protein
MLRASFTPSPHLLVEATTERFLVLAYEVKVLRHAISQYRDPSIRQR